MDPRLLQNLKQRYQFDDWYNRTVQDENLFIWQARLSQENMTGWEPMRVDVVPPAQTTYQSRSVAEAKASRTIPARRRWIQSTWRPEQSRADCHINVDLAECSSRSDAHQLMLRLLGDFQFIALERLQSEELGDVSFGGRGNYAVLFARGNLVLMLQNAGRTLTPITDAGRSFDIRLASKPIAAAQIVAPTEPIRTTHSRKKPASVNIYIPYSDSMYKFFSRSGEIGAQANRLVYTPVVLGSHQVEVYEVSPGSVSRQEIHLKLE